MNQKILIADDDEILCQEISEILSYEGYSVTSTSTTEDAKKIIDEFVFDIAVFDYKMQSLTGIDLLKKVKMKNSETRIIIMSGRPFMVKILEQENVLHLVSGILIKPFNDVLLLETLRDAK
ncbi:MAG: response regulator [Oligoflexia bacterium]|nr:response regulator [Oligoflexia bacterium]